MGSFPPSGTAVLETDTARFAVLCRSARHLKGRNERGVCFFVGVLLGLHAGCGVEVG